MKFNDKIEVGREFNTSFIISPWKNEYYMVIKTKDGRYHYKTDEYELGDIKHNKTPINLGNINLKKSN